MPALSFLRGGGWKPQSRNDALAKPQPRPSTGKPKTSILSSLIAFARRRRARGGAQEVVAAPQGHVWDSPADDIDTQPTPGLVSYPPVETADAYYETTCEQAFSRDELRFSLDRTPTRRHRAGTPYRATRSPSPSPTPRPPPILIPLSPGAEETYPFTDTENDHLPPVRLGETPTPPDPVTRHNSTSLVKSLKHRVHKAGERFREIRDGMDVNSPELRELECAFVHLENLITNAFGPSGRDSLSVPRPESAGLRRFSVLVLEERVNTEAAKRQEAERRLESVVGWIVRRTAESAAPTTDEILETLAQNGDADLTEKLRKELDDVHPGANILEEAERAARVRSIVIVGMEDAVAVEEEPAKSWQDTVVAQPFPVKENELEEPQKSEVSTGDQNVSKFVAAEVPGKYEAFMPPPDIFKRFWSPETKKTRPHAVDSPSYSFASTAATPHRTASALPHMGSFSYQSSVRSSTISTLQQKVSYESFSRQASSTAAGSSPFTAASRWTSPYDTADGVPRSPTAESPLHDNAPAWEMARTMWTPQRPTPPSTGNRVAVPHVFPVFPSSSYDSAAVPSPSARTTSAPPVGAALAAATASEKRRSVILLAHASPGGKRLSRNLEDSLKAVVRSIMDKPRAEGDELEQEAGNLNPSFYEIVRETGGSFRVVGVDAPAGAAEEAACEADAVEGGGFAVGTPEILVHGVCEPSMQDRIAGNVFSSALDEECLLPPRHDARELSDTSLDSIGTSAASMSSARAVSSVFTTASADSRPPFFSNSGEDVMVWGRSDVVQHEEIEVPSFTSAITPMEDSAEESFEPDAVATYEVVLTPVEGPTVTFKTPGVGEVTGRSSRQSGSRRRSDARSDARRASVAYSTCSTVTSRRAESVASATSAASSLFSVMRQRVREMRSRMSYGRRGSARSAKSGGLEPLTEVAEFAMRAHFGFDPFRE